MLNEVCATRFYSLPDQELKYKNKNKNPWERISEHLYWSYDSEE